MIVFVLYVFSLLLVQGIADYMLTAGERERERERARDWLKPFWLKCVAQVRGGSNWIGTHRRDLGHWTFASAFDPVVYYLKGGSAFVGRLTRSTGCNMVAPSWDGFNKVRSRRPYYVCGGCEGSWIWADRVSSNRWCCDHCGSSWPTAQAKDRMPQHGSPRPRRARPRRVEAPPGLGGREKKPVRNPVDDLLKKSWTSLNEDVKKALQSVGIDYTPEPELQPLEVILQAHLEALPKEVKEAVESLVTPAKQEPKDVTTKLKATVGELRQLSNKKAGLQKRVDSAKDQYKILLDELKTVQEQIDKEQQQLTAQSEAYAKLLKEENVEDTTNETVDVDGDMNDHVLKALAQVGILYTDAQKTDLERHLAENKLKRRKKSEIPSLG